MIGKLFRRTAPDPTPQPAALPRRILRLPAMPSAIYAIGDVHGRTDLYDAMIEKIVEDGRAFAGTKLIVLLGDIVDRTTGSAGMIDRAMAPAPAGFQRVTLCGNHEDMMLKFIDEPGENKSWLDFGGTETLLSYGLKPSEEGRFDQSVARLSQMMQAAIPEDHQTFLAQLPVGLVVGNYRFAHAFYDLAKPMEQQIPRNLMWGRPTDVEAHTGPEILIHGHVITETPYVGRNRINVDTGAYTGAPLTAVRISADQQDPSILQVR